MEKLTKPQEIYVVQRRLVTVFFAFLSLIMLACVVSLPVIFSFNPAESFEENELRPLVIGFSFAAAFFGIQLLFIFIALIVKLRRTVQISVGEKGIYLYSTLVPYGLIEWSEIKDIKYFGLYDAMTTAVTGINRLLIELRDAKKFKAGLNFLQKAFFTVNLSILNCNLMFCKGKGAQIGAAVRQAWEYYSVKEVQE